MVGCSEEKIIDTVFCEEEEEEKKEKVGR